MIAPEPFFEPRGTPFSEFHRIRALTELGHTGRSGDVSVRPGRDDGGTACVSESRPPFVTRVGIGPSLAKLPLDALLTLTVVRRAMSARYDAVHSHEEGGVIGVVVAALLRIPHLYDMHSSLPQQLTNFAFSRSRLIRRVFLAIERVMIRRSRVVIVICPSLQETVRAIDPAARSVLIENAPGSSEDRDGGAGGRRPAAVRAWPLDAGRAVHRHVRGVPGTRSAVRRHGARPPIASRTRGC